MDALTVLFIDCTLKRSPELSHTESLWHVASALYHRQGCHIQSLRLVDYHILPGTTVDEGPGDDFPDLLPKIQQADILIVGIPVIGGMRSSACQMLIERLQGTRNTHAAPSTGQPALYNTVIGLALVADAWGVGSAAAQTSYDFNQLGCISPPNNTVAWMPSIDSDDDFMAAEGQTSVAVNRDARLLVEHSVAIARLLKQSPLTVNQREMTTTARAIAKAAKAETATLMTAKSIRTDENLEDGNRQNDGIHYRHITKRIWTVMQEGMRRGFALSVLSLDDKIFRAERDGKGFIYKIYPGHFSFRRQYEDYDAEQAKSRKLALLQKSGLAVPVSYGLFKTVQEIPLDDLRFPIVAKPNSGSLSQNVFPNLQTREQLIQAVSIIEANGDVIKLESHISGQDYRVLTINHQYAGCVERRPASIIGDGIHTVRELFHLRNQEPGRGDRHEAHTTIHQLVFDRTSRELLHEAKLTLDSIVPLGRVVFLQRKITASTGSDYVDHTDHLHLSIIQSCVDFSYRFSTLTLGFDLITSDISRPLSETRGAFNEYNFLPYVDLHENCNVGQKRPVCRLIWDHIEANADEIVTTEFNPF
ncbi:MAG: NAD(P)H-dependent oxidoreductase [Cyanobacteria bacterium J06627_8]